MKKSVLLSGSAAVFATLGAVALVGASASADSTSTEVNLIVNPVLSITATESLDLDVIPTTTGAFTSGDIDVNVITNSATGYKLYLSSNSAETALTNSISSANIPTISTVATSANMASNTWGYSLSDTFNPVPANTAPEMIKETSTAAVSTADVTTVTVGAKVDTSIPSDVYSNTLLFTATAKDQPYETTGKWTGQIGVTKMQQMTSAKCNELPTPDITATETSQYVFDASDTSKVPELSLRDTRDGKYYLVRKYADGNCWMAQNLDLEDARTLTANDTDLNGDITTFSLPASSEIGIKLPDVDYIHVIVPGNNQYLVNSGSHSSTGQPYEHRGNWYSWGAATAGSYITTHDNRDVAASSICPKGWQLPAAYDDKSWFNLFATTYQRTISPNAAPFNIPNADFHDFRYGYLYNGDFGRDGYYWTNTAGSTDRGYYLRTGRNTQYQEFDGEYSISRHAKTVRCVAR
jgi:uncharacterized protein (TIGR02145 family)